MVYMSGAIECVMTMTAISVGLHMFRTNIITNMSNIFVKKINVITRRLAANTIPLL